MIKQKAPILFIILITHQFLAYGWEMQYNYFNYNLSLFNPAAVSVETKLLASVNYRFETTKSRLSPSFEEWSDNYRTDHAVAANIEFLSKKLKGGVGVGFLNDFIINNRLNNRYYLNYAYHWQLSESLLSFGAGAFYHQVDREIWDNSDPIEKYQDRLNINIGAYYHHSAFDVGISVCRINTPIYYDGDVNYPYRVDASLMVNGGYHKSFYDDWEWKIDALLQATDSYTTYLFIRNSVTYKDLIWAGFGVSGSGALSAQIGGTLYKKISLGYSYQGDKVWNSYFYQAHEFFLTYRLE